VKVSVTGCARCGRDHEQLEFRRLFNPVDDREWWTSCPTNGEPLLLKAWAAGEEPKADECQGAILREISDERASQDAKWGDQRTRPLFVYNAILGEEVGEVAEALLEHEFGPVPIDRARAELIQVAAVAVAMVEAIDFQHGVSIQSFAQAAAEPEEGEGA